MHPTLTFLERWFRRRRLHGQRIGVIWVDISLMNALDDICERGWGTGEGHIFLLFILPRFLAQLRSLTNGGVRYHHQVLLGSRQPRYTTTTDKNDNSPKRYHLRRRLRFRRRVSWLSLRFSSLFAFSTWCLQWIKMFTRFFFFISTPLFSAQPGRA